jgi:hypothetical protein
VNVTQFLDERLIEDEARFTMFGDTLYGAMGQLQIQFLRLKVEVIRSVPIILPPMRHLLLRRIAKRHWGHHPDWPSVTNK